MTERNEFKEYRYVRPEHIREWRHIAAALETEAQGHSLEGPHISQFAATPIERFVYEYEDADEKRAAAFRERLLAMVNATIERFLSEEHQRAEGLQAKLDALMFEYCPEDMTPEQIEEWGRHQRPVSPERQAELDAALGKPLPEAPKEGTK